MPRQPGLVPEAGATVEVFEAYAGVEAFRGLEAFSHVWIVFLFHESREAGWRPTVRPPRLGGDRRVGVFASRSPYRPNPIGMSAVALEGVEHGGGITRLRLKGVDLLDGTPVLDIKPYVPYADAVTGARGGYAPAAPEAVLEVVFTDEALARVREEERGGARDLEALIVRLLGTDPRPAYYGSGGQPRDVFGMRLLAFDLRWRVDGGRAVVVALDRPGDDRDSDACAR